MLCVQTPFNFKQVSISFFVYDGHQVLTRSVNVSALFPGNMFVMPDNRNHPY